jgi:hypothetical protein
MYLAPKSVWPNFKVGERYPGVRGAIGLLKPPFTSKDHLLKSFWAKTFIVAPMRSKKRISFFIEIGVKWDERPKVEIMEI